MSPFWHIYHNPHTYPRMNFYERDHDTDDSYIHSCNIAIARTLSCHRYTRFIIILTQCTRFIIHYKQTCSDPVLFFIIVSRSTMVSLMSSNPTNQPKVSTIFPYRLHPSCFTPPRSWSAEPKSLYLCSRLSLFQFFFLILSETNELSVFVSTCIVCITLSRTYW